LSDPLNKKRRLIPVIISCKGFDKCEKNICPRKGLQPIDLTCNTKGESEININGFKKIVSSINSYKTVFFLPPLENVQDKEIIKHYKSVQEIIYSSVSDLSDYWISYLKDTTNPFDNNFVILQKLYKATIVIADITYNNPSITYLIAIRKALNKPIIILQPLDLILNTPFLPRDSITEYNKMNLFELKQRIIEKIEIIEKNFDKENELGYYKQSNEIADLVNVNQPESRTPEQISKIEENASKIWICTNSLQKDVDGETIQESVEFNLNRGKKYTYFLSDTDEVKSNINEFKKIHNKAIKNRLLKIIPIPDENYRLFEEIAIYFRPREFMKDIREGYTMITLKEGDVVYLKLHKNITDRIYKTLKKFKEHYSIFFD